MSSALEPRTGVQPVPLEVSILYEQLRVLLQRAVVALPSNLINAAVLVAVMWSEMSHRLLLLWGGAVAVITAGRLAMVFFYNRKARQPADARSWVDTFLLGTLLGGASWGVAGFVFYDRAGMLYQLFICFILGGLAAGATASASCYPPAFAAFTIPALAPLTVRLLGGGDKVHFAMGTMLGLFAIAMSSITRAGGRNFVESVRLRFEAYALRSEREALLSRYRAASEASLDAFFLLESVRAIDTGELLDFACVDLNTRAEELLGLTRQEALGRLIGEVFPYASSYVTHGQYAAVIATQMPTQDDFEVSEGVLAGLWIERQIAPLPDGVAVTLRDVTKAKQAEREIHASLRQKEILLREVHHRVKNNLQMISSLFNLQAEFIDDPRVLEIFQDSQSRVRAIATVHQRLYQSNDLAEVDVREYLRSLVADLRRTFSGDNQALDVVVDVQPVGIGIDTAIPCGLVVNELVTNCIKHAFRRTRRGQIRVEAARLGEDSLRIAVSDDGDGFPEHLDFRKTQTLGLQLVCMLTQQMKGEVVLHRGPGTRFEISIKLVPPNSTRRRSNV